MMRDVECHAILTQGRSGSSYLWRVLHNHPSIANYGEVLGEWTECRKILQPAPTALAGYLDELFGLGHIELTRMPRKGPAGISTVGIKEFCINFQRFGLLDFLPSRPHISIIYLRRQNLFHRHLSLVAQRESGVSNTEHPVSSGAPRVLDPEDVIRSLTVLASESRVEANLVARLRQAHRIIDVDYEAYFESEASKRAHEHRIFEFLHVRPIPSPGGFRKILPTSMRAAVANYDELRERCQGTPFEVFMNE